jgi:Sporulation and spore germination
LGWEEFYFGGMDSEGLESDIMLAFKSLDLSSLWTGARMITNAQSRHNRIISATVGFFFITGVICLFYQDANAQSTQLNDKNPFLRQTEQTQSKKSAAHLYFADRDYYYLTSEQRTVSHSGNSVGYAAAIVEALIKGPQNSLVRTLSANTKLRAIYLTPDGACYVDLSLEVRKDHPGGCNSELLTIYSVVNSLILNVPEIKRVKLLIDGKEAQTLAGHIDLAFPFEANMLLIR